MPEHIAAVLNRLGDNPDRFQQIRELLNDPERREAYSDYAEQLLQRESTRYSTAMLERAAFYGQLIQREGKRLRGEEQLDALAIMNEQFPRIVEAIDNALSQDDASLLAQFASRIAFPLLMQGKLELGSSVFRRLLNQAKKTGNRLLEIRAATQYATFLKEAGRTDEAQELSLHTLELARLEGDEPALAEVLICLGNVTPGKGQYKEAIAYYAQALELARKLRDKSLISNALSRLGVVAYSQSRLDDARQLYTESLETARETGYVFRIAGDLHNLANVVQAQGDYRKAQSLFEEALGLNRLVGNRIYETRNLMGLARIAMDQGRFDEAKQLFSSAQLISVETGKKGDYVDCEYSLGVAAACMENYEDARRHFETGIQLARERGSQGGIGRFLRGIGALHFAHGEYKAAEPLLLEAMTFSKDLGTSHTTSFDAASLGLIALETGKLPEAVDYLIQALDLAAEAGRLHGTVIALQAGVVLLAKADRASAAELLACGVTQQVKRLGLGYNRKWHRDLDEAIAQCSSLLTADQSGELEHQAASMSIEELTDYALEALEKLKAELDIVETSPPSESE